MDLSINNVNLNKKDNINFKGLMGEYNKDTVPVYKFTAPPHKNNEKVTLELSFLEEDKATAQFYKPKNAKVFSFEFPPDKKKDNIYVIEQTLEIPQAEIDKKCKAFGYRFKITDENNKVLRYELDPFRSIETSEEGENAPKRMNVIEVGRFYGISPKGGTMRHSFLDSDVRLGEDGKKAELNADFVRNHFNKLGGSIAGLNWLLKNTNELSPYTYFMTTPDIGADKISSHGYWPANHYQCSDLETFKDFNFELFKQGKGYVADGAFTSQGIQSPLVQHVLKWGKESPFYHWLKIDGIPSLGVLPDVSEVGDVNPYEHIGVRLVNGKGEGYDKTKPTYIQFYDKRLLSDEKRDSNELVFNYDRNDVDDIYEITSHQDSVQPYAFEIDPNDKKLEAFDGKKATLLSEIDKKHDLEEFLTFPNFRLVEKNKVGGATCWDGNVDIIKMNLSNPTNNPKNIQGYRDARQYLLGVAEYWTKEVQAHLILETAKSEKNAIADYAKNNGIDDDKMAAISNSIETAGTFVTSIKNENAASLIREFPLQSLETSEELSAIFAQKEFMQELLTPETLKVISDKFDEVIRVASNGKGNQYQAYLKRTYGNEILRYIFVSAIAPEAIEGDSINLDKLKQVTLKSLQKYKPNSVQEERKQVVSKIQKGLGSVDLAKLSSKIKDEVSSISLNDFKMAEAVVLQGKGGLNWRFDAAKDIGDLDAVRNGEEFAKIWNGSKEFPGVQQFWGDFVEGIRKYNPAAYVINEVTSLNEFCNKNNPKSMKKFDPQLAEYYYLNKNTHDDYEDLPHYQKQVQFLNQTNSTTTSEYAMGFNAFSKFAGVDPEKNESVREKAGVVRGLKVEMEKLMQYNQPNSAIFSHMFVSNHDKPSVLHTLPLNMSLFLAKDVAIAINALDDDDKKLVAKLLGNNPNYKKVCAKALGVGVAMLKTIERLQTNPPNGVSEISREQAQKLEEQLVLLVNGQKTPTSKHSFKRAEAFGVKPYEITIKDLIKKSGIASDDKKLNELTKDFHYTMLEDSMDYFQRLWQVMNACVGVPTLYGGNEFAQTGYETSSKNVYLGIRNEILHDLKDDERYSAYYKKMCEISGMAKKPELSALRDGTPMSFEMISTSSGPSESEVAINRLVQKALQEGVPKIIGGKVFDAGKLDYFANKAFEYIEKGNSKDDLFKRLEANKNNRDEFKKIMEEIGVWVKTDEDKNLEFFQVTIPYVKEAVKVKMKPEKFQMQIWPIAKKNDKSQTISIITNLGMPYKQQASCEDKTSVPKAYKIQSIELKDKNGNHPFDVPDGYVLKKVGDNRLYKIKDGCIVASDGNNIVLNDTVSTFYIEKKGTDPAYRTT